MSFVFYDTETTGTDKMFSQILQFGAIRTNDDLNEIDRFEIRCQLLPHIVPSPGAMAVTGVTVKQLTDPALPTHYEMAKAIRGKLSEWSPAVFIGHNSLSFDEQMLRQAFYQTLHPIYLTNTGGNSRIDSLPLLRATVLFYPDAIAIPINEKGKPSFKLDRLSPHNGFTHANAHDAMADVEATIFMCKLVRERATELWQNCNRLSKKMAVSEYAFKEPIFSLTEFKGAHLFSSLVTAIGVNPERNTDIYVFDLTVDPSALLAMPPERYASQLKKTPKPVRIMKSNACPCMRDATHAPDSSEAKALGMEELSRRAAVLKTDPGFRSALIQAFLSIDDEEREPSPHIEHQIYEGFYTDEDQRRLEAYHLAAWEERLLLLSKLEDKRLRMLARRLIYFERPELLDEQARKDFGTAIAKRLLADETTVPWLTLPRAIAEIEQLLETAEEPKRELLAEHREYLLNRLGTAKVFLDSAA